MKKNNWIRIGALFAMVAAGMGAFGAHALKGRLDDYSQGIYAKAVLYQMFHTMGIFVVGLIMKVDPKNSLNIAGVCFSLGIALFSGSLYLLAITGNKWLGMVTPLGGLCFIAGWVVLFTKNR